MNNFSGENLSLNYIWQWYKIAEHSILRYRDYILSLVNSNSSLPELFIGFTIDDVRKYFNDHLSELDKLVCFNLISSAEAMIRIEYLNRATKKDKDDISPMQIYHTYFLIRFLIY